MKISAIRLIVCHFGEFCNVTQLFGNELCNGENSLIFCDKSDGVLFASFDQAAWVQPRALVLKSCDKSS